MDLGIFLGFEIFQSVFFNQPPVNIFLSLILKGLKRNSPNIQFERRFNDASSKVKVAFFFSNPWEFEFMLTEILFVWILKLLSPFLACTQASKPKLNPNNGERNLF